MPIKTRPRVTGLKRSQSTHSRHKGKWFLFSFSLFLHPRATWGRVLRLERSASEHTALRHTKPARKSTNNLSPEHLPRRYGYDKSSLSARPVPTIFGVTQKPGQTWARSLSRSGEKRPEYIRCVLRRFRVPGKTNARVHLALISGAISAQVRNEWIFWFGPNEVIFYETVTIIFNSVYLGV